MKVLGRIIFCLAVISLFVNSVQDQTIPVSSLYYDIEYKQGLASFPAGGANDSTYTVFVNDTIRFSWWHSVNTATVDDSTADYDRLGGWVQPATLRGIQDTESLSGRASHQTDVFLPPGDYKFRIWAFWHKPENPAGQKWIRSPAPSDEIQLKVIEKPIGEPAPKRPVIIDIVIKPK